MEKSEAMRYIKTYLKSDKKNNIGNYYEIVGKLKKVRDHYEIHVRQTLMGGHSETFVYNISENGHGTIDLKRTSVKSTEDVSRVK